MPGPIGGLGDQEKVVEEKDIAGVLSGFLVAIQVANFVEGTVANETPVGEGKVWNVSADDCC